VARPRIARIARIARIDFAGKNCRLLARCHDA
jgi:hypothetical protein